MVTEPDFLDNWIVNIATKNVWDMWNNDYIVSDTHVHVHVQKCMDE